MAETVGCSVEEAKEHIKTHFNTFKQLKKWLTKTQEEIKAHACIYSVFGRKRRLQNVYSPDKGIAAHEVRSGVNAAIQSVASDINLLAAIDLNLWLKENNKKSVIFGLVHDSILLEVALDEKDEVLEKMAYYTQLDRGASIPGSPIGIDVESGATYAFKEPE